MNSLKLPPSITIMGSLRKFLLRKNLLFYILLDSMITYRNRNKQFNQLVDLKLWLGTRKAISSKCSLQINFISGHFCDVLDFALLHLRRLRSHGFVPHSCSSDFPNKGGNFSCGFIAGSFFNERTIRLQYKVRILKGNIFINEMEYSTYLVVRN